MSFRPNINGVFKEDYCSQRIQNISRGENKKEIHRNLVRKPEEMRQTIFVT